MKRGNASFRQIFAYRQNILSLCKALSNPLPSDHLLENLIVTRAVWRNEDKLISHSLYDVEWTLSYSGMRKRRELRERGRAIKEWACGLRRFRHVFQAFTEQQSSGYDLLVPRRKCFKEEKMKRNLGFAIIVIWMRVWWSFWSRHNRDALTQDKLLPSMIRK